MQDYTLINLEETYEYLQSIRVISKLSPVALVSIERAMEEIERFASSNGLPLIAMFKDTLLDIENLKKQINKLLTEEQNDKRLINDLVHYIKRLVDEMLDKVQEQKMKLKRVDSPYINSGIQMLTSLEKQLIVIVT
ncbi:hypothetical protein [Bacillus alkalicellulosilyticus]|uniref:hypothetical protein n=1 Tax=Alkalihalobacterium alkalicellulosilyticum TaxID=1912214 RepID=UPI00099601A4|nr:hypothetical protein [Bacillus alkalicellulosilyticus]